MHRTLDQAAAAVARASGNRLFGEVDLAELPGTNRLERLQIRSQDLFL